MQYLWNTKHELTFFVGMKRIWIFRDLILNRLFKTLLSICCVICRFFVWKKYIRFLYIYTYKECDRMRFSEWWEIILSFKKKTINWNWTTQSACWFDSGGLAVEILWFWWLNSGNFVFDSDQLFDLILSILVETLQFGIRISYFFKYTREILRTIF